VTILDIHDTSTSISELVAKAVAGDEVLISKDGQAVARLVSLREPGPEVDRMKAFGMFKGRIHMEHFDDPLPLYEDRRNGTAEREALLARLEAQPVVNIGRWTRDELHDE